MKVREKGYQPREKEAALTMAGEEEMRKRSPGTKREAVLSNSRENAIMS